MKSILLIISIVVFIFYNLNLNFNIDLFSNIDDKIIIIIPYRDRKDELLKYIYNMKKILNYQKVNFEILIVEQSNRKKFNKGKLNNIGFIESLKKNNKYNKFLFNDVDNYPLKKNLIDYNIKPKGFHHYFGFKHCLGGFFMVDKYNFRKSNGYSNKFWGWGGEDTDLQDRVNIKNIPIYRDKFILRKEQIKNNVFLINDPKSEYTEEERLNHSNLKLRNKMKKKYKFNSENIKKDGLTNCKYNILKSEKMENNIKKITVSI